MSDDGQAAGCPSSLLARPSAGQRNEHVTAPSFRNTPNCTHHAGYAEAAGRGRPHSTVRCVALLEEERRHPCRKASSPSTPGALAETDDVGDPADPFPVMHYDGRVQKSQNRLLRHLMTPNSAYLSHPWLRRDRLRSSETSHTHKTVNTAARRTHPLRSCSSRFDIHMVWA